MRRLGYDNEAKELARRLAALVPRERLREYYDPYSGRGMGARRFAWSTLILELTDPDPLAASSYLGVAQAPRYGSDDEPGQLNWQSSRRVSGRLRVLVPYP